MGNSFSVLPDDNNSSSDIKKKIDDIAINYILTQNSIDLIRFTDKEYYDNVIVLTANILKSNLNNVELGILNDRVQFGDNINGDNKLFVKSESQLKEISIKNDKVKEKALHYVSKFYVKIMTIFSAIVATIDPKYINETDGQIFSLKDYDDFKYIDGQSIKLYSLMNPMGLIMKRLNILKNKMYQNKEENGVSEYVTINPGEKFCKMNEGASGNDNHTGKMTLQNEIGIKELDRLYYDIYDYDDQAWSKKSEKMEQIYERDLDKFYTIFTGNNVRPDYVKSFEDIELLQYHNLIRCKNEDFFKDIMLSRNDPLLIKYTTKIDEIHNMVFKKKQELLFVLQSLFLVKENQTENGINDKRIVLNPDLNLEMLKKSQEKVKDIILDMYTHCEYCFIQALMIYELIYNEKYGELNQEEIEALEYQDESVMKSNVGEVIGNSSIYNANANDNKNMLPEPGIDVISPMPQPLTNKEAFEQIETGNSSIESNNNDNNINKPLLSFSNKPTPQFILNANKNTNKVKTEVPLPSNNGEPIQNAHVANSNNGVIDNSPAMIPSNNETVMNNNEVVDHADATSNITAPPNDILENSEKANNVNNVNNVNEVNENNIPMNSITRNANVMNQNANRNTLNVTVPVENNDEQVINVVNTEHTVNNNEQVNDTVNAEPTVNNNEQVNDTVNAEPTENKIQNVNGEVNNESVSVESSNKQANANNDKSFIQKITGFFSKKPEDKSEDDVMTAPSNSLPEPSNNESENGEKKTQNEGLL
jgi:hypothetical protein